jgi:1-phosphofructokinase
MIITIALNPGIEKRIVVDQLVIGEEHKVLDYQLLIGRSSVYSAYIMKILQGDPYVMGFAGGIGGRYIKNFLDKNRIKSNFVLKDQEMESVFLLRIEGQPDTRLVDHSHQLTPADGRNFKHKLTAHLKDCEIILLNGDTLDAIAMTIMTDTMAIAKKENTRVVLAVEGNAVGSFISKAPYAWVVDDEQLEALGISGTEEQRIRLIHDFLIRNSIHYAFYPTAQGVIGVTRNKICMGQLEGINVKKTGWVKEAIAGGVAIGIKRKYEFERMVKLSSSIVSAINEKKYPNICTRKEIDQKMNQCKIVEYYSKGLYHFEGSPNGRL